jgi:hypothetical protein
MLRTQLKKASPQHVNLAKTNAKKIERKRKKTLAFDYIKPENIIPSPGRPHVHTEFGSIVHGSTPMSSDNFHQPK